MPSAAGSGTTSALTIGTETTLFDSVAAGIYVCQVDLSNMAAADIVIVRNRVITLSGDTVPGAIDQEEIFSDAQAKAIFRMIPVETDLATTGAIRWTIQQTVGTGRTFKWVVKAF